MSLLDMVIGDDTVSNFSTSVSVGKNYYLINFFLLNFFIFFLLTKS